MKRIVLAAFFACAASVVVAGTDGPPAVESSDSGTSEGALILLALVGMVIASGQLGGVASRNTNKLDIDPSEADNDAGF